MHSHSVLYNINLTFVWLIRAYLYQRIDEPIKMYLVVLSVRESMDVTPEARCGREVNKIEPDVKAP